MYSNNKADNDVSEIEQYFKDIVRQFEDLEQQQQQQQFELTPIPAFNYFENVELDESQLDDLEKMYLNL